MSPPRVAPRKVGSRSAATLPWTCLLRLMRFMKLAGDLSVHRVRRQIDLLEEPLIPQRREYASQFFAPQPYAPRQSVFEPDEEAVLRFGLNFNYVPMHRANAPFMPAAQFSPAPFSRGRIASLPAIPLYVSSPILDQVQCPATGLR